MNVQFIRMKEIVQLVVFYTTVCQASVYSLLTHRVGGLRDGGQLPTIVRLVNRPRQPELHVKPKYRYTLISCEIMVRHQFATFLTKI